MLDVRLMIKIAAKRSTTAWFTARAAQCRAARGVGILRRADHADRQALQRWRPVDVLPKCSAVR